MTYFDYDLFANLKDGDIVFFDELLNANPMILNACLTVLEDRVLPSGRELPDIMIVAAANPQGAAILTPQIKERFIWYDVKFNKEKWRSDYIEGIENWNIPDNIFNPLCTLINNETFSNQEKNYYTPRSISKCIKMSINGIKSPLTQVVDILNTFIENTSETPIKVGDYDMLPNEKLPWLKIQKLLINDKVIKQQESTITDGIFS